MKHLILAGALVLAPLAGPPFLAQAQDYFEDVDFTDMDRGDFVAAMQRVQDVLSPRVFELFTRVDPSIEAHVPDLEWTHEHTQVYGCLYDGLAAQDALDDANVVQEHAALALAYLDEHPDLNFATLEEHPDYLASLTPPPTYLDVASDCGLMSLNARAMSESGIMQALQRLAADD